MSSKTIYSIVLSILLLGFIFSHDAPRSELWRKTYKQCFLECVKAGNKQWCNLHCVSVADRAFKKEQNKKRRQEGAKHMHFSL